MFHLIIERCVCSVIVHRLQYTMGYWHGFDGFCVPVSPLIGRAQTATIDECSHNGQQIMVLSYICCSCGWHNISMVFHVLHHAHEILWLFISCNWIWFDLIWFQIFVVASRSHHQISHIELSCCARALAIHCNKCIHAHNVTFNRTKYRIHIVFISIFYTLLLSPYRQCRPLHFFQPFLFTLL